ncbi:MAG: hypothetical protein KAT15_23840 [Bacteroidales bacterium]|nr:hypothetical protein [Bacteroidales bacterium]
MGRIKSIGLLVVLIIMTDTTFGQSRKTIKEKGIVKQTVEEYFIEEGMNKPVIESVETYNSDGELTEIQEFNRRGEIRKWEKYAYDDDGELVEEVFINERGKVARTEKNIYEDGLRVEKQYYNERGKLYKKKAYLYEYSK